MKNIIKILSICFWGLAILLTSCGKADIPFPEAENADRTAFIHFFKIDAPQLVNVVTPESTAITLGALMHPFGTDNFTSIDICVVKNRTTEGWKSATLGSITSLSLTDTTKFTYTIRQLLDATGGGSLAGGDQFSFYYTVHTKAGKIFPGWTKLTGFTTGDYAAIPMKPGQTAMLSSNWSFNIACEFVFADLLGDWELNSGTWWGEIYDLVATEDPDKPGSGLIFTNTTTASGGSPAFDRTLKVEINMATYAFNFPSQVFYDDASWIGPGYSNISWSAGSGNLSTCGTFSFSFTTPWLLSVNGEPGYSFGAASNVPITFTKK
ncbi:MAG: hypothetical protein LBU91_01625 [Bacteroidales bacterium]|nr:hypothetical protein [Bacteroidales bacterium]